MCLRRLQPLFTGAPSIRTRSTWHDDSTPLSSHSPCHRREAPLYPDAPPTSLTVDHQSASLSSPPKFLLFAGAPPLLYNSSGPTETSSTTTVVAPHWRSNNLEARQHNPVRPPPSPLPLLPQILSLISATHCHPSATATTLARACRRLCRHRLLSFRRRRVPRALAEEGGDRERKGAVGDRVEFFSTRSPLKPTYYGLSQAGSPNPNSSRSPTGRVSRRFHWVSNSLVHWAAQRVFTESTQWTTASHHILEAVFCQILVWFAFSRQRVCSFYRYCTEVWWMSF